MTSFASTVMPGRMGGNRARTAARDNTPGGRRVPASLAVVDEDLAVTTEADGELVEHAALTPIVKRRTSRRSHFLWRTNTSTSLTQRKFPILLVLPSESGVFASLKWVPESGAPGRPRIAGDTGLRATTDPARVRVIRTGPSQG